jgi:hypothetical protein
MFIMATKKSTKSTTVVETTAAVVTPAVETTVAAPVVAVKAPTKTSQALEIFNAALEIRQAEIAANVPMDQRTLQEKLGASVASAAGMYNNGKIKAEKLHADLGLGRDPKKEKPVRAPKTVVVATTTEVAPAAPEVKQENATV